MISFRLSEATTTCLSNAKKVIAVGGGLRSIRSMNPTRIDMLPNVFIICLCHAVKLSGIFRVSGLFGVSVVAPFK